VGKNDNKVVVIRKKGQLVLTIMVGEKQASVKLTSRKAAFALRDQLNQIADWHVKLEFVKELD
jgi:hypothetical protein